ncbi:MAG TPA: hypothetical protein VK489_09360 [Ferruginibacter sp.]|nr:hypothetical protein [Ferruginibacter sp.]
MKKLLLLILSAFISAALYSQGQQIKIASFTVKNQLPSVIDSWNSTPGSLLLVAQMPPTIQLKDIRLILQIRSNGAIICSNNSAGGIAVDNFTTRTFSASELTGAFAGCADLKEGNYTICAQFFVDRRVVSNEMCREFSVEVPKETDHAPPTLINPDNGKSFTEAELSRPVSFRWTPLVPKPRDPVTYRLKVWQLMEGQNGPQAMRSNQPIVTKDVDNITQAVVNGIYTGPCKPPYLCDFIWQVQAMNKDGKPMGRNNGNSEPYSFSVKQVESGELKNAYPENNKRFSIADAKKRVVFRWTPLIPKPKDPVTYRLKVWQLMEGQNGTQAMKDNKPVVTKEVTNITEATVNSLYTGPCKPPYLCDFIWNVQAVTREGSSLGSSEPYSFKILDDNINTRIDSVSISCCIDGKQNIYIKINNLHLTNQAQVTAIKYRVNGTGPLITLSPTAPPLAFTIAANSTQAFTASINCVDSMKTIKFIVDAIWPTDPDNINNETAWDTLHCACDACDEKHFTLKTATPSPITYTSNTLGFNQAISVTTVPAKTIKTIKAELVYFEMVPENDMCIPCNKDAATYGHFTNGTNSQQWNGAQQTLNINITTPQLTPCCSAVFRWCIRYKVEFADCTTCNKLVCYEKKKEGCEKAGGGIVNPNDPK